MTLDSQGEERIGPKRGVLRLVVIIPALNEEHTIVEVIASVPKEIPGVGEIQIVVVDDGSHDRTALHAVEAGAELIRHPRPGGVGSAFHSGLAYAIDQEADLVVTIDADGQFEATDIPTLIEPVVSGNADFATASRFVDPALTPEMPRLRLAASAVGPHRRETPPRRHPGRTRTSSADVVGSAGRSSSAASTRSTRSCAHAAAPR